jgi:hypothetical protein
MKHVLKNTTRVLFAVLVTGAVASCSKEAAKLQNDVDQMSKTTQRIHFESGKPVMETVVLKDVLAPSRTNTTPTAGDRGNVHKAIATGTMDLGGFLIEVSGNAIHNNGGIHGTTRPRWASS